MHCYDSVADVTILNVLLESANVSWRIPSFKMQEEYYLEYGTDPSNLDQTSDILPSPLDTSLVNQTYQVSLQGLNAGTIYYLRVVAVFEEVFKRYSDDSILRTKENGEFNSLRESHTQTLNIFFSPTITEQAVYLGFLPHTNTSISSGMLETCDDCTSYEITLPGDFPFGGYFHQAAYVS